jgi:hypothetical protein
MPKSCLNLDTHEIMGIFETPISFVVCAIQPRRSQHCEKHVASTDGICNVVGKPNARWNVVNISKNSDAGKSLVQGLVKPPRPSFGIRAPVVEKYAGHGGLSCHKIRVG